MPSWALGSRYGCQRRHPRGVGVCPSPLHGGPSAQLGTWLPIRRPEAASDGGGGLPQPSAQRTKCQIGHLAANTAAGGGIERGRGVCPSPLHSEPSAKLGTWLPICQPEAASEGGGGLPQPSAQWTKCPIGNLAADTATECGIERGAGSAPALCTADQVPN